jgi:acetate---CoA ligase (ADP-forming)
MAKGNNELDLFFYPSSVAIVGASEKLSSYGARYIQALLDFGYKGKIYAVNHTGNEVLGYKIYHSVLDIPDNVDLAAICVANHFVPRIIQDCVNKKIKAAIVLSAGFSESGGEGRLFEEELAKIAEQGIRIMGPNCFGTYCPNGGITILPGAGFPKQGGGTALIAQSGQLSEMITARSFGEGIRYSKVASYGNACNINEAHLLDYLIQDDETRIITSYLEGVRDGHRFFEIARRNVDKKPLLLWKVGFTNVGAAAARSHTNSLAGSSMVWDAFYRQTHAIKINSLEELVDTNIGFSCLPAGCGRRIALISGGGAGTVIGADAAENAGLIMPPLTPDVDKQLRAILPPVGTSIKNPLDIGFPHPSLTVLQSVLETLAASDQIDVVVIRRIFFSIAVSKIFAGTAAPSDEEQQALLEIPINIKKKYGKPVIIILPEELTGADAIKLEEERRTIRDYFFKNGIPVYPTENRAFTAIAHLTDFKDNMNKHYTAEESIVESKTTTYDTFSRISKASVSPILNEIECKEILKEAGVNVVETKLAKTREEALAISKQLGYPVVMKIISPQITHKSDIGGVKLGLKTSLQVGKAYDSIMNAVRNKASGATIEGVSIQKMAPSGVELVIGMTKDSQFGSMLMFGLGGIFIEVLKDVSFRIVPLSREDAREMIREIKGFRLLEGYRGQPPVNLTYLEELLLKVSRVVTDCPQIKEMDINPIIAYADGAVAVDARIILEPNNGISG